MNKDTASEKEPVLSMLVMLMDGGGLHVPPPLKPFRIPKGGITLFGCNFLHAGLAYKESNIRAFAYVTTPEFASALETFNATDTNRGVTYLRDLTNI